MEDLNKWKLFVASSVALDLPDVTFQGVAPSLVTTTMTSLPHSPVHSNTLIALTRQACPVDLYS